MSGSESNHEIPSEYRLVHEVTLSFLWYQTAGITLRYFGVGKIQPISDAERIDCVAHLDRLYQEHGDVLSGEAALVMDCLIAAALDLAEVSGH